MSKIPEFNDEGFLPIGVHWTTIENIESSFCFTEVRKELFSKLKSAIKIFKKHGCKRIYIDGSFSTSKLLPNDIDVCWDSKGVNLSELKKSEPVFFNFKYKRAYQKMKYGCEFFPSEELASINPDTLFLDFFQRTRDGNKKGIIGIKL